VLGRLNVLVTDYAWPSLDLEQEVLGAARLVDATGTTDEELLALARDADAILTNWRWVPPEVLDAALRCRIVCRYGIGVDNIPVARATELGIAVANVPAFCVDEVSEHTLALVLACVRRIVPFARGTAGGGWDVTAAWGLRRLAGSSLGLVGYGALARALAPKARALGMRVVAWTPRLVTADAGVEVASSLHELLAHADVVSLHAPSTPETKGLIGEHELAKMKPTAYLVNTSRGALVDEAALVRALDARSIAGAALDVLDGEPPADGHPLLGRPDVVVTPHVAFYSEEAVADMRRRAAQNALAALRGEVPADLVNPHVAASASFRLGACLCK
jgi:D-3-phosphoglycerate dehydrogenase